MKKSNEKKYILSIETTGRIAGVALTTLDKIIYEINLDTGLTHSETLFCNIDKIFKKNNIDMSDIAKIKVSYGPGSFTGIRIGIACALGLSSKYNTKIEYVDTLKSLAYNVKGKEDYIISMIDARADRVYLSIYKSDNLNRIIIDKIVNIKYLCNLLNMYFTKKDISFIFVGDGSIAYKSILNETLSINYKIADKINMLQRASSIAFTTGIESKTPLINYLQASKAERELNAKN